MKSNTEDRMIYIDYLRVFATFAVIIIHVAAKKWYSTDVNGFDWQVFNFYDAIARWAVPIFVMISGTLFLNREIPQNNIYSKYILRMIISFIVWSIIYVFFQDGNTLNKIIAFVRGHYHMWYIPMIVGIYMCIPFIKPIVECDKKIKYFLWLAFWFSFIIPETVTIVHDFGSESAYKLVNGINQTVQDMKVYSVSGYVVYFVLGYYMNKLSLNKKQRICIYILGFLGFIFTIALSLIVSLEIQKPYSKYYGNFTVNVFFEALAVFTWFKYRKYQCNGLNVFVQKLSKYSFGAYLVHALVFKQLNVRFGLNVFSFNSAFSVLYIGIIVFIISFLISAIINHIPILKKYIV